MLREEGSLTLMPHFALHPRFSQAQCRDRLIWSNFFKPRSSSSLGKASADKLAKTSVNQSVLSDDVLCLRIYR